VTLPLIPILKHIKLYRRLTVHRANESDCLYIVPLSAINGFSSLTMTSYGQARQIRKFSNRPIIFELNQNGRFNFESNLEALQVPNQYILSEYDISGYKCICDCDLAHVTIFVVVGMV